MLSYVAILDVSPRCLHWNGISPGRFSPSSGRGCRVTVRGPLMGLLFSPWGVTIGRLAIRRSTPDRSRPPRQSRNSVPAIARMMWSDGEPWAVIRIKLDSPQDSRFPVS